MKAKGALILAIASLGSYLLGLGRDHLLARTFGASVEVDLYNSAFIVPEFLLLFWITGALSLAVVPVVSSYISTEKKEAAFRSVNVLLGVLAAFTVLVELLAFFFMPVLSQMVAPGYGEAEHVMITKLSRLLLISAIFFTLSGVWGSVLVGSRRFTGFALSPIFYNLGIIIGIVFFSSRFGIEGAVYGAILGAALHVLVRVPELWKVGYRPQWIWDLKDAGFRKIMRLTWPRMGGLFIFETNLWLYNALASYISIGSIAAFNFARNFQSVPVSLFGISLATAAFPVLSGHFAAKQENDFREFLARTLSRVLFFTLPATLGLLLLASPIIATFLEAGRFTPEHTEITSLALFTFSWAVVFESMVHVLARAFYARQDTFTPMKVIVVATLVNMVSSIGLSRIMGVAGLTLSFTLMVATQTVLLLWLLRKRLGTIRPDILLPSIWKTLVACMAMGVVVVLWKWVMVNPQLELGGGVILGAGTFLSLAWILRIPELQSLKQLLRSRLKLDTPKP